jgi:predicted phosphodiesterase
MRIIALGDTHGRVLWKEIVAKEKDADKIVFIGDYFDTHYDITVDQQIQNFKEILEFKKNNMDQVVLLLGNHDFHYLKDAQEKYSGFNAFKFIDINEILEPAVKSGLVQMCFVHDKYVFTHAGVTKTWAETYALNLDDLENSINQLFVENIGAFRFSMGDNYDQTGNDVTQTPIWVRIPSLLTDKIDGVTYVIGHTTLKELTITANLIGIDTIGTTEEYLEINDLTPIAKKV